MCSLTTANAAISTTSLIYRLAAYNILVLHLKVVPFEMTTHEFLVERFSWIGIEMFQSIINSDRSKAIVQCFDLCSALGKGENYSSFLIRAKVDYSNGDNESIHTKSFIIKVASGESRSQDVFAKEYFLYTEIIPKMQNALRTDITPLKLSPK